MEIISCLCIHMVLISPIFMLETEFTYNKKSSVFYLAFFCKRFIKLDFVITSDLKSRELFLFSSTSDKISSNSASLKCVFLSSVYFFSSELQYL